jgi:hypothetical protein
MSVILAEVSDTVMFVQPRAGSLRRTAATVFVTCELYAARGWGAVAAQGLDAERDDRRMIRLILNILWWLALAHVVAGVVLCVTIIGIPFGVANVKLVPAAFWPLGREVTDLP